MSFSQMMRARELGEVFRQRLIVLCNWQLLPYTTWPIVLASFLLHPDRYDDPLSAAYRIENATFFLWPIQGLLTCLVYFRPRIMKGLSKGANKMKNLSLSSANKKAVASTKANSSHEGNMDEQADVEKAGRR